MKTTLSILLATAVALPAMAETTTAPAATTTAAPATTPAPAAAPANSDDLSGESALSPKRFSGLVSVGYDSNYTGRGIVISHSVAEGDSAEYMAVRMQYDMGSKKKLWTAESLISYRTVTSGHTLYGNPQFGPDYKAAFGVPADSDLRIKECNLENEFAVKSAVRYTTTDEKYSVAFGHSFVHGGILGVMAKHYRNQGSSCTNELFISQVYSPEKWVDLALTVDYSVQGITGWWFEPSVTFKAPIIGTPDDVTLAGRLTFAMSATADYYNHGDFACHNGTQAFWIKFDTPWFVNEDKSFIITPYISFNWLGKGAVKANENSEFKKYTQNNNCVPFRNFGVVAGVSATFTF